MSNPGSGLRCLWSIWYGTPSLVECLSFIIADHQTTETWLLSVTRAAFLSQAS